MSTVEILPGVASVHDAPFPGVPDRRLWVLTVHDPVPERFREIHAAAWRALDATYDGTGPEGLLAVLDAPDPELEWAGPPTLLAGYTEDGRQARIAYFTAARTPPHPGWPPVDPPYRLVPFAEQSAVTADDVVALWLREGGLDAAEARRRVDEILLVAIDDGGTLAGVTTSYLQRSEQLQLDLWHMRALVSAAHRRGSVATALAVGGRDHLEAAFVDGRDRRAPGLIHEVENPALKQMFHHAVWNEVEVVFIGENARGDHVRVYYFDGARLP